MQSCEKMIVKWLGQRIKLIPRSHINVEEYLIKANVTNDVEQTKVYLDLQRARNLVKGKKISHVMSLIKSRTPENARGDTSDGNGKDEKDDTTEVSEIV